jgi:hypothetical protein
MWIPTFCNNTQPAQHHWHDFELFPLPMQIQFESSTSQTHIRNVDNLKTTPMQYYQPGYGPYYVTYRQGQFTHGDMKSIDVLALSHRTPLQLQAMPNTVPVQSNRHLKTVSRETLKFCIRMHNQLMRWAGNVEQRCI